ncbi:MAG TPA: endonuclease MutS2 [Erysipelotrichaceae bacterium]|nr:endonuclease MutS2 [Erysipelotrichaceae bacterium]
MTWDVLEYPLILDEIAQYTQFSLSRKMILDLKPSFKPLWVNRENNRSFEAMELLRLHGPCPMAGMKDIRLTLEKASKDMVLGMDELMDVAVFGRGVHLAKQYHQKAEIKLEALNDLFESLQENVKVSQAIEACISPNIEMMDQASTTLAQIRQKLRRALSERDGAVQRFMQTHASSLADNISTIRNDRVVVLIKASDKNKVGGLIHGESASGLSAYVEPPVLLELNNRIQEALTQEQEEIFAICKGLSALIKPISDNYLHALETMAYLDTYFARAYYGEKHQGRTATISDDKQIFLKDARHPLIDAEHVVANTYRMDDKHPILLITGPNTGGKTVSLKIVGLFTLMAYSGIPVLADEAIVPMFDQIFVDIGDDQSIVQSLSTFSAHLSKLAQLTDKATANSLVLLDELGGGTDPQEGESLAIAVLEFLRQKGVKVIATTHYSKLKEYALIHRDILLASVQFDMEAMRPTFKYLEGIAGQSFAFEIAARFNLNSTILEHAKELKLAAKSELALLQERLDQKMLELKQWEEKLDSAQSELDQERNTLQQKLLQFETQKEKKQAELQDALDELYEEAQIEAEVILSEMRSQDQPLHTLIEKKKQLSQKRPQVKTEKPLENIELGQWVKLKATNQQGKVIQLKKKVVVVMINGIRMEVSPSQLTLGNAPKAQKSITITQEAVPTVPLELNVIGYRVEEALPIVSQYIDQCLRAKMPFARIIHGHGTGALRQAVHGMLAKQERIESYRLGGQGEGGVGATVVQFKGQT